MAIRSDLYAAYLTALTNRRQKGPELDSWPFDGGSAPTGSPEPQAVHSSLDEILSDASSSAPRPAAGNGATKLGRPQDGGMFGPPGPLLSFLHSVPTSGGAFGASVPRSAALPARPAMDFSSGFRARPFNELSATNRAGDGHSQAWPQGPNGDHRFGRGTQFAENGKVSSHPPFAGSPAKSDYEPARSSPPFTPADGKSSPAMESASAPIGQVFRRPIDLRPFDADPRSFGSTEDLGAGVGSTLPLLVLPNLPNLGQLFRIEPDVLSEKYRALAHAVRRGEGADYESHNTGTIRGSVVRSLNHNPPGTVTGKTIDQILATERLPQTDQSRLFAFGPYGITFDALRVAKHDMRLAGNERMTPEMQDRIFAGSLIRRDLKRFLNDPTVGVDQAQYSAARQWASIAVPKGFPTKHRAISDGTMTYYDDKPRDGKRPANKANVPATREFRKILEGWHGPTTSAGRSPPGSGR